VKTNCKQFQLSEPLPPDSDYQSIRLPRVVQKLYENSSIDEAVLAGSGHYYTETEETRVWKNVWRRWDDGRGRGAAKATATLEWGDNEVQDEKYGKWKRVQSLSGWVISSTSRLLYSCGDPLRFHTSGHLWRGCVPALVTSTSPLGHLD